jgi:hypothetical protein
MVIDSVDYDISIAVNDRLAFGCQIDAHDAPGVQPRDDHVTDGNTFRMEELKSRLAWINPQCNIETTKTKADLAWAKLDQQNIR